MDIYTNLAGTTASGFRISKGGPKISPGTADPNVAQVTGSPGDIYILQGESPRVYMRSEAVWLPLSTDQQFNRTKVQTTTFIASNENYYLGVATTSATAIYLPVGSTNKRFIIKDERGLERPITIYAQNGQTIDGQATYVLSVPYSSINLVWGDEWHVY